MLPLPTAKASRNMLVDFDQEIQFGRVGFEQDTHALIDDEAAQAKHVGAHVFRQRRLGVERGIKENRPDLTIMRQRILDGRDAGVPVLLEPLKLACGL